MARIIVTTSTGDQTVELDSGQTITIGRDPANRLPLPDETGVSRRHCRIGPREGGERGWEVADLGSTNGTRVDGQKVKSKALVPGDVVEVGSVRILFEDPEEQKRRDALSQEGVCFLEWVSGDTKGSVVPLDAKRVTIGRRDTNGLPLDDRMVSGHHAEIDRDLNGYTIRDLGSTNGTLVNGEPISEALLTHGARVRIGNCRFVFKDPSMKDVEVALDTFEEDEGWGMMGEIDLSRSRGSKAGILVILLLFAAAGAGGWYLSTLEDEGGLSARGPSNLVENGAFEEEDVFWSGPREEGVAIGRQVRGGVKGGWLSAKNEGEEDDDTLIVAYETPIETAGNRPLQIEAAVKRQAKEGAEFVVVWASDPTVDEVRAGVSAIERTDVLSVPRGSWTTVNELRMPPSWARNARIGVRLPAGAGAGLDSVRVTRAEATGPRPSLTVPVFKTAELDDAGTLELLARKTVLLTGVRPIARLADGTVLTGFEAQATPEAAGDGMTVEGSFAGPDGDIPARVAWTTDEEGLRVELACDGAAAVGLEALVPTANLGATVNVLGDFLPQSIPLGDEERLEKVSRTLIGKAVAAGAGTSTTLAFVQADKKPIATLEFGPSADAGLASFRHWVEGASSGTMHLMTDFTGQQRQAEAELKKARGLESSRPGEAITAFRALIIKWPFEKEIRDDALARVAELEKTAQEDVVALADAVTDYRVYRSADALLDMENLSDRLEAQYLGEGAQEGTLESEIAELVSHVVAARTEFEVEVAAPGLDRLERLYLLLEKAPGYEAMAALYARALGRRYEHLKDSAPDVARRVQAAQEMLSNLTKEKDVDEALPPVPEAR